MKNLEKYKLLNRAIINGDEGAFKKLYEIFHGQLSAYINSYTKNSTITQDIVQDTFIKLWKAKSNFDSTQSIIAYLFKTAYNTFIDNYRKQKKQTKLMDSLAHKKMLELLEEDEELKQVKINLLMEAIENLPPKCKNIFLMSKYQGYKYAEIATELNISIKTVETQMRNAFITIRKRMLKIY